MTRPCIFFDRDGIVNRSPGPGYVERVQEFHLVPEFIEALQVVSSKNYPAIIATNQRGIALGLVTAETLEKIHTQLRKTLAEQGLTLLDIMVCPHDDHECACRKPQPGLLIEAAQKHDLDLSASWMIGDSERDVVAGQRAGCRTVLVGEADQGSIADFCLNSMEELPVFLKNHLVDEN